MFYQAPLRTLLLRCLTIWSCAVLLFSACQPTARSPLQITANPEDNRAGASDQQAVTTPEPTHTPPYPARPRFAPGELVDYTAQSGDTLPQLARRFNTTVSEILEANTFIPASATTMPPGMPMKIPIYYQPLWGSPYKIIPDSYFINGPIQVDFDTRTFVVSHPGWLKNYTGFVSDANRTGPEIVDFVAQKFSLSPRLLLALLEYQAGALSQPELSDDLRDYPLGYSHWSHKGVYLQLVWLANLLNNSYYGYRIGRLTQLEHNNGRIEKFDPWINPATVSLQAYFNATSDYENYLTSILPGGFEQTYRSLFGDPWLDEEPHIPGSLEQPAFIFPFQPGDIWALTGGPHTAWGTGDPLAALDFAPPSKTSGCIPSDIWATAVSSGVVTRSENGEVVLDLDGDGDERTGWVIFYLHVGSNGRVPLGAVLQQGDSIGHPSCEGGSSTGTHVHVARKYNGEWLPAEGVGNGLLAFNFEGWVAHNGLLPYLGTLTRNAQLVTACTCSNATSFIQSDRK